ncbi:MAG: hypothetical protein H0X15_12100 [Acidobacteria bacterium]|nr:hypothetical protein [Acidobacteriota bacterium]
MSLQQQQNFLAKLYTDEKLRRAFLSEPSKIGEENFLNRIEIAEIAEMLPEEISFFSESLFWKRLREVEKFLPLTRKVSGDEFQRLFRQFSQSYNPQTIKKHLEDANEFCAFLQKNASVSEISKNTARYEQSKLKFYSYGKKFVVCKLNFDVREIGEQFAKTSGKSLKKKTKIAVWFRVGNTVKHFFI